MTTTPRLLLASLAAAAVATIGGSGAAFAEDATPPTSGTDAVVALVQPSIVYLTTTYSGYVWDPFLGDDGEFLEEKDGDLKTFSVTTQCSAFAVSSNGYLATAGHCVDRKDGVELVAEAAAEWANATDYYSQDVPVEDLVDDYEVDQYDAEHDELLENTVFRAVKASWSQSLAGTTVEKQAPARVIAAKGFNQGDAALLKVEGTGFNALPLAADEVPEIGADVITVGYPGVIEGYTDHDLVPTFNPTTVSSHKSTAGGLYTLLQLSTTLAHGMSGGPTVNLDGEVVGINSSVYTGEEISNAVPVERIIELMNGAGVDNELSATTQAYRDGVLATLAGDKATAVEKLAEVVEQQPGNEFAADYLARAKALPDPVAPAPAPAPEAAEAGGTPWALVGGVVGGVLVLLGLVVTLVSRGRRTTEVPQHYVPATAYPQPTQPYAPPAPAPSWGAWAGNDPAQPTQRVGFGPVAVAPARPAGCGSCGNPQVTDQFCGRCGAHQH